MDKLNNRIVKLGSGGIQLKIAPTVHYQRQNHLVEIRALLLDKDGNAISRRALSELFNLSNSDLTDFLTTLIKLKDITLPLDKTPDFNIAFEIPYFGVNYSLEEFLDLTDEQIEEILKTLVELWIDGLKGLKKLNDEINSKLNLAKTKITETWKIVEL